MLQVLGSAKGGIYVFRQRCETPCAIECNCQGNLPLHLDCMSSGLESSLTLKPSMRLRVRNSKVVVLTINRNEERTEVGTSIEDFDP